MRIALYINDPCFVLSVNDVDGHNRSGVEGLNAYGHAEYIIRFLATIGGRSRLVDVLFERTHLTRAYNTDISNDGFMKLHMQMTVYV